MRKPRAAGAAGPHMFAAHRGRPRIARVPRRASGGVLVALAVLVPFAAAIAHTPGLGNAAVAWFALQCHRDPARSLTLFGAVLPVCARCSGLYAGVAVGALIAPLTRIPARAVRGACLVGAAVLLAAVLLERGLGFATSNGARWLVGLVVALPFGSRLAALVESVWTRIRVDEGRA